MFSIQESSLLAVVAAQHGVFNARQAEAHGVGHRHRSRRVAEGRWFDLGYGLFSLVGSPPTWRQRLWLGLLEAPPGSAISHCSSKQLFGLPLRPEHRDLVEVLTANDLDHRARFSRLHQTRDLPPEHLTLIDGIPVTTLARTLFDQAAHVHPRWLETLTDAAMHRCDMPIEQLVDVTLRLAKRGRKGGPAMRKVVARRMGDYTPAESVLESEFIDLCERYGLPEPRRQVELGDGARIGRVDFFFPPSLVVEVDGRAFHAGLSNVARDEERDRRLGALGLAVKRFGWAEVVGEPAKTARKVRRAIAAMHRTVGDNPRLEGVIAHSSGRRVA